MLWSVGGEAWGADESFRFREDGTERWREMFVPPKLLVVHHTATRNSYETPEEAMAVLQQAGIAAGACHTGETLMADPHLRARGFFQPITHPEAGTHDYLGVAWGMSAASGRPRLAWGNTARRS